MQYDFQWTRRKCSGTLLLWLFWKKKQDMHWLVNYICIYKKKKNMIANETNLNSKKSLRPSYGLQHWAKPIPHCRCSCHAHVEGRGITSGEKKGKHACKKYACTLFIYTRLKGMIHYFVQIHSFLKNLQNYQRNVQTHQSKMNRNRHVKTEKTINKQKFKKHIANLKLSNMNHTKTGWNSCYTEGYALKLHNT